MLITIDFIMVKFVHFKMAKYIEILIWGYFHARLQFSVNSLGSNWFLWFVAILAAVLKSLSTSTAVGGGVK